MNPGSFSMINSSVAAIPATQANTDRMLNARTAPYQSASPDAKMENNVNYKRAKQLLKNNFRSHFIKFWQMYSKCVYNYYQSLSICA